MRCILTGSKIFAEEALPNGLLCQNLAARAYAMLSAHRRSPSQETPQPGMEDDEEQELEISEIADEDEAEDDAVFVHSLVDEEDNNKGPQVFDLAAGDNAHQADVEADYSESELNEEVGAAMMAELGKRVCPGDLLYPRMESVFTRMHKDADMRQQKIQQKREAAKRERIERERQEVRVVRGSTYDVDFACSRLYTEAEDRRARLARKQQEHELMEDIHFGRLRGRCNSTPSLLSESTTGGGDCHWDRMYAQAQAKEEKLEKIRREKAEQEMEYLERHSVHRINEADEPVAFDRLYHDSVQRKQRLEQKRQQQADSDVRRQGEESVHRKSTKRHSVEAAANRMYNEAKNRQMRLAEKRRSSLAGVKADARRTSSVGAISTRLDALYDDAARRRTCREIEKEQKDREEIQYVARNSVHNAARERIAKEREAENMERVFERVHNPTVRDVMHTPAERDMHLPRRKSQPQLQPTRQDCEPEMIDRPIQRRQDPSASREAPQQRRKSQASTAKQDARPVSARGPLTELSAGRNNARHPRPATARHTRTD